MTAFTTAEVIVGSLLFTLSLVLAVWVYLAVRDQGGGENERW